MKKLLLALLVVAVIGVIATQPRSIAATTLTAQKSDAAGVRVVVKPKSVGPNMAVWEFEVTTDTHTTPLTVDLVKASILIDEGSRRYTPTAWEGDPPGGHHRKGILKFSSPPLTAKSIKLEITDIGGSAPRVFHWTLAN